MKILYIQEQGIGNMVFALPSIVALCEDGHDVTVVGKLPAIEIVPDKIPTFTLDDFAASQTDLTGENFDQIILSHWSDEFQRRFARHLPPDRISYAPLDTDKHELEHHFELVNPFLNTPMGLPGPGKMGQRLHIREDYEFPISPADLGIQKRYVVIANTAAPGWDIKRWHGYPELIDKLHEFTVVCLGTEHDRQHLPDPLPDHAMGLFDLNMRETAWLLKNARCVIGNDCGLVHLASAMLTPTIAIFGPTTTTKNMPISHFINDDLVSVIRLNLNCSPCQFSQWDGVCEVNECLQTDFDNQVIKQIESAVYRIPPWREDTRKNAFGLTEQEKNIAHPVPDNAAIKPALGITIRVKNAIDTIEECITEAARIADKLLIVDNGSTDGTLEWLFEYSQNHPDRFLSAEAIDNLKENHGIESFGAILLTEGTDEPRDRRVMDAMLGASECTWGMFIDSDEIISKQITREQVLDWMTDTKAEFNGVAFRHVHFWNDKDHYRIDQRWKPRHNRMMFRITPEATLTTEKRTNPEVVRNLKGRVLATNYVIKHYGHIDKEKNRARQKRWREIDNPSMQDWSGISYDHMTDESYLELAEWHEEQNINDRPFGSDSVLLVLLHGNGDLLMATPAIKKLKDRNPQLQVSVLGLGQTKDRDFKTREIFENNPDVFRYYDSAIDHHPTWWDTENAQREDVPVIQKDIAALEQLTRFDEIRIITLQQNRELHRIESIARACGIEGDFNRDMRLYPDDKDQDWARDFLERHHERITFPLFSVHRLCGHPPKNWDAEECRKLCEFLTTEMNGTVLYWGHDIEMEDVIKMSDYADEITVNRTYALMEICAYHIGADSFPMHIAAAAGIPTIGIFESTIPSSTAPLNPNSVIAASAYSVGMSNPDFFEHHLNRLVVAGVDSVKAEHIFPILRNRQLFDEPIAIEDSEASTLYVPPSDKLFYEPLAWNEQQVIASILQHLQKDDTFLDIGANVGTHSLAVARQHDELRTKIISVEPSPYLQELIAKTRFANFPGCSPDWTIETYALGDVPRKAYLNYSTRQTGVAAVADKPAYFSDRIKVQRLDDLEIEASVIKIDVEGDELAVINGGENTISNARCVIVECHGDNQEQVRNALHQKEFAVDFISSRHLVAVKRGEPRMAFALNSLYNPAELLSDRNTPLPTLPEGVNPIIAESPLLQSDQTGWFECLGLIREWQANPLIGHVAVHDFKPSFIVPWLLIDNLIKKCTRPDIWHREIQGWEREGPNHQSPPIEVHWLLPGRDLSESERQTQWHDGAGLLGDLNDVDGMTEKPYGFPRETMDMLLEAKHILNLDTLILMNLSIDDLYDAYRLIKTLKPYRVFIGYHIAADEVPLRIHGESVTPFTETLIREFSESLAQYGYEAKAPVLPDTIELTDRDKYPFTEYNATRGRLWLHRDIEAETSLIPKAKEDE